MKCKLCNKTVSLAYTDGVRKELKERQLCFGCNFWYGLQYEIPEEDRIIIDGEHYVILPDSPQRKYSGYGGREFVIKRNDGSLVVTRNLWHQGSIPEQFKSRFTNNACFLETKPPCIPSSP